MDTTFINFFASLFFAAYILMAFVLPSVRTYKRTGVNPITFGRTDNAHNFIGRWFKVILALIPLVIMAAWAGNKIYAYLLPADYLRHPVITWAGLVLCLVSFVWTVVAQWQMGTSWRIGIDEAHRTKLVTIGLFAYSRNPIFLGMQITLAGFFLLLPNAITLLTMIAGCLLVQIQTRLEEEFLQQQHGIIYKQYLQRVNRFI